MTGSAPPDNIGSKVGNDGERDALDVGRSSRDVAAHVRGIGLRRRLKPLPGIVARDRDKAAQQFVDGIGRFVGIVDQQVSDQRPQDGLRGDEMDLQFGYGPVPLLFGARGGHGDGPFPYMIDGLFAVGGADAPA